MGKGASKCLNRRNMTHVSLDGNRRKSNRMEMLPICNSAPFLKEIRPQWPRRLKVCIFFCFSPSGWSVAWRIAPYLYWALFTIRINWIRSNICSFPSRFSIPCRLELWLHFFLLVFAEPLLLLRSDQLTSLFLARVDHIGGGRPLASLLLTPEYNTKWVHTSDQIKNHPAVASTR